MAGEYVPRRAIEDLGSGKDAYSTLLDAARAIEGARERA